MADHWLLAVGLLGLVLVGFDCIFGLLFDCRLVCILVTICGFVWGCVVLIVLF